MSSFVGFSSRQELGKRLGKDMKAVKARDADTKGTADLTMSKAVELCLPKQSQQNTAEVNI